jgi:hypothetical protein
MNRNGENLPVYNNEFDDLNQMIATGEIKGGDGIEVVDPRISFIKHYFTFERTDEDGYNWFFVSHAGLGSVQLQREDEIANLADKFKIGKVKRFIGDQLERKLAIERGHSILGKKYYWVGANCENSCNFIQTGISFSNQTRAISTVVMVTGVVTAAASKNKTVQAAGILAFFAGLFALLVDLFVENDFQFKNGFGQRGLNT